MPHRASFMTHAQPSWFVLQQLFCARESKHLYVGGDSVDLLAWKKVGQLHPDWSEN